MIIKINSNSEISLFKSDGGISQNHQFGKKLFTSFGAVTLDANPAKINQYIGKDLLVQIHPVDIVVGQFLKNLKYQH